MTGAVDPFVTAIKTLAFRHRNIKALLEASADRVASGIKKNITQGINASPYVAEGAPRVHGNMTPLSRATLEIRKDDGITSTRPYFASGYTLNHIGGHSATETQIKVGGTDVKAQRCILLNYGTDNLSLAAMHQIRQSPSIASRAPKSDIPARNPIGYTKETADAIFRFWQEAFLVNDTTYSVMKMDLRIFL